MRRCTAPVIGGVVALGAAAGEHDLARPAADDAGDAVAGLVDGSPGVAGEAVRAARVGEALGEERQHGVDRVLAASASSPRDRGTPAVPRPGTLTAVEPRRGGLYPVVVRRRLRRRLRRVVLGHQRRRGDRRRRRRASPGHRPATAAAAGPRARPSAPDDWRSPLADRDLDVSGVDASAAMLDRLQARDPERPRHRGPRRHGRRPPARTVRRRARRLQLAVQPRGRRPPGRRASRPSPHASRPGGAFVVEAFVPEEPPRHGTVVGGPLDDGRRGRAVDLRRTTRRPSAAAGHFVQFTDGERVRLRPWAIRYAPPAELDAMAAAAGLVAASRAGRTSSSTRSATTAPPRQRVRHNGRERESRNEMAVARDAPVLSWTARESDAPQPTHRAVGHDRGRAGRASVRLRATGRERSRPTPTDRARSARATRKPPSRAGDRRRRRAAGGCGSSPTCTRPSTATPASSSTTSARSTSPPRPAASTRCSCTRPTTTAASTELNDDDAEEMMHALQRRLAEHADTVGGPLHAGDHQPRPRGRRLARPPARPDPRPAVRAGRDPRRGAGLRPLRRRLRHLHDHRGRAGRRRARRVRRRRRRVHRAVLERRRRSSCC